MSATENQFAPTSARVRLTPSSATEPCFTIRERIFFSVSILRSRDRPSRTIAATLPTPSMCPETRCPPSSSPNFKLFSRFTFFPFSQELTVVFRSVSGITKKENELRENAVTVKQMPLTAMLAPFFRPVRVGVETASAMPPRLFLMLLTFPTDLIIPVNIV